VLTVRGLRPTWNGTPSVSDLCYDFTSSLDSIAVSPLTGDVYITNTNAHCICKITDIGEKIFAGDDAPLQGKNDGWRARFNRPSGLLITSDERILVADTGNDSIRVIYKGFVQTLVKDRALWRSREDQRDDCDNAVLASRPIRLAVSSLDGEIYVTGVDNHSIHKVGDKNNEDKIRHVQKLAGGDEPGFCDAKKGLEARFNEPQGIAIGSDGTLYIGDTKNHRIRMVAPDGKVSTLAGIRDPGSQDGPMGEGSLINPMGLCICEEGYLNVADNEAGKIRRIDIRYKESEVAKLLRQCHALQKENEKYDLQREYTKNYDGNELRNDVLEPHDNEIDPNVGNHTARMELDEPYGDDGSIRDSGLSEQTGRRLEDLDLIHDNHYR